MALGFSASDAWTRPELIAAAEHPAAIKEKLKPASTGTIRGYLDYIDRMVREGSSRPSCPNRFGGQDARSLKNRQSLEDY